MPKNASRHYSRLSFIIILILAGFLIFYHGSRLFIAATQTDRSTLEPADYGVFVIRFLIITSLLCVITRVKSALLAMWISISGLVVIQYLIHFDVIAIDAKPMKSATSYLRGFIIPAIITLFSWPVFSKNK